MNAQMNLPIQTAKRSAKATKPAAKATKPAAKTTKPAAEETRSERIRLDNLAFSAGKWAERMIATGRGTRVAGELTGTACACGALAGVPKGSEVGCNRGWWHSRRQCFVGPD